MRVLVVWNFILIKMKGDKNLRYTISIKRATQLMCVLCFICGWNMGMIEKRKRLIYRSVHRGCKELDLLLGEFATQAVNHFDVVELERYECIVDADDYLLYNIIVGNIAVPSDLDSGIMNKIIAFNKRMFNYPKLAGAETTV